MRAFTSGGGLISAAAAATEFAAASAALCTLFFARSHNETSTPRPAKAIRTVKLIPVRIAIEPRSSRAQNRQKREGRAKITVGMMHSAVGTMHSEK
jgi:hypothetical protein